MLHAQVSKLLIKSFVVQAASGAGQDIRPVGCDIKCGQAVLQAGDMLDAPEIGILATVGSVDVKVTSTNLCFVLQGLCKHVVYAG